MFIAGAVITLLLWKVVPIFATLFAGLEVALPLPTRIVIGLSNAVGTFALPAIIFLGLGGYGVKMFYRTPQGRLFIDRIILNLPLVGPLMRKISVGMVTRTLGTLIFSGVPMLEAMEITARTSGNAVVENAILKVRLAIEAGRTIVDPLRETGVFPNLVVQMIGVGTDRIVGLHAPENRRFLRRRSRCRGRGSLNCHGTVDHPVPGRSRRRCRNLNVPSLIQFDRETRRLVPACHHQAAHFRQKKG